MEARYATENLTIHCKVKDHSTWRPGYDADEMNRASAGLSNSRVFCRAEDPDDVAVLLDVADVAKARAWSGSPGLKMAMEASASRPQ
jgi:hypothetical protein